MSACANGDVQRVQKAEELLTVNRDSAMAILREVVRPDQLPEESKALYSTCSLVKVSKPSTNVRPKSVRNSPSPKPKTSQQRLYKKATLQTERCL